MTALSSSLTYFAQRWFHSPVVDAQSELLGPSQLPQAVEIAVELAIAQGWFEGLHLLPIRPA